MEQPRPSASAKPPIKEVSRKRKARRLPSASRFVFAIGSQWRERDCLDLYKVLGVDKRASDKEIKAAFKKQALKVHPDVNKSVSPSSGVLLLPNGHSAA